MAPKALDLSPQNSRRGEVSHVLDPHPVELAHSTRLLSTCRAQGPPELSRRGRLGPKQIARLLLKQKETSASCNSWVFIPCVYVYISHIREILITLNLKVKSRKTSLFFWLIFT